MQLCRHVLLWLGCLRKGLSTLFRLRASPLHSLWLMPVPSLVCCAVKSAAARLRLNNCSLSEQFNCVQGGKMAAQYDQTAKERNLDFEKVCPLTARCLVLQLEQ